MQKISRRSFLAGAAAFTAAGLFTGCSGSSANDGYTIGICQLMLHDSVAQASQGFKAAVVAALGEDKVTFIEQDAAGELANCATVMDGFIASGADLILANGTAPLQAAVSATAEIPILGTSITDYAAALNITDWNGTVGGNVSGTTDLAPLDQQAAVIQELFPDAKTVGLLYCSSEPNSIYQITRMTEHLEQMGYTCREYAFNDVNDLSAFAQVACDNSDVIYIPTDNTAAAYPETIANTVIPAGVPVVTGDANTCAAAGVATLSISYYDLGYATGEMAVEVLTGKADISTMPVRSAGAAQKLYHPANCQAVGVSVPEGYTAIE